LRKSKTLAGKAINIGRFNFTSVAADIRKSHIVHEDDYDVGPVGDCRGFFAP
jgi:hypothetical protein